MRKFSRHIPKFNKTVATLNQRVAISIFITILLICLYKYTAIISIFCAVIILSNYLYNLHCIKHLNELKKLRVADPSAIGYFARSFDCRAVDTNVIRAVYEQLQSYISIIGLNNFPIRSEDRLREDLKIDDEDLEIDLAHEISYRSSRSLDFSSENPHFGNVKTVKDLVLFFNLQPKTDLMES